MSRIGVKPITVPAGVEVTVAENNLVTVKGPKGTLTKQFSNELAINKEENTITVVRPTDNKKHRSLHGLTRTLLDNMIIGVTAGFEKKLELVGVGYRAQKQGKKAKTNVLKAAFPGLNSMKGKYPYLDKYPFLLPVAYVARFAKYGKENFYLHKQH